MVSKTNKMDWANLGEIPNLFNTISLEKRLEIFRKICFIRYFEKEVIKSIDKGLIKCPVYLSIGQEAVSSTVSAFFSSDLIFAQHRAHSVYLAFGGDPGKLIDELLGRDSGCSQGKGGSNCIQDSKIGMVGHHGLIGENVPLAVGAALGDKSKKVVCFFGDGAAEEDYVFSSIGFAITHRLPILFICEDNDLSILTKKADRRSWKLVDAIKAIGMSSIDITDDPWLISYYVEQFSKNLPGFINCRTCRHYWHAGIGIDSEPKWDRLKTIKKQFLSNGFKKDIEKIENETKQSIEKLWKKHLEKQ
ncbi:hypothetical protein D4R86_00200 [bacterium]|nr:MAG: hypothetical protein D4R86_00200 [bacterium]